MNVIGEHGMRAGPRKISGKTVGEHMGYGHILCLDVHRA